MSRGSEALANPLGPLAEAIAEIVMTRIESRLQRDNVQARLFTVQRAAEYMGRSAHSIRHLCNTGKLPVVRIDGRVFLDRQDLDRIIEESKQTALQ